MAWRNVAPKRLVDRQGDARAPRRGTAAKPASRAMARMRGAAMRAQLPGIEESTAYGTHSLRRTKAAQIYKKTGNLRAVELLLGHTKLESTVRYLGIEVDDALSISEQVEL